MMAYIFIKKGADRLIDFPMNGKLSNKRKIYIAQYIPLCVCERESFSCSRKHRIGLFKFTLTKSSTNKLETFDLPRTTIMLYKH